MKNIDALQKEINDLKKENVQLESRLEKTSDESAKLFLQNLINYNEEKISNLVNNQIELSK
jgi:hypothetical protein